MEHHQHHQYTTHQGKFVFASLYDTKEVIRYELLLMGVLSFTFMYILMYAMVDWFANAKKELAVGELAVGSKVYSGC
ncbi:MAG: hypothetical protein H0U44_08605 [Flavisolibacter sp.]|nr:hypothetical protein [Flavisolibacter sp.]